MFVTICITLVGIKLFEGSINTRNIEEINMDVGEETRLDELQALVGLINYFNGTVI